MSLFRCDACGVHLPAGSCKARIGVREFCGPDRSPCHALGLRSAEWRACRVNGYKSHVGLGEPTDLWRIFNPNEPAAA